MVLQRLATGWAGSLLRDIKDGVGVDVERAIRALVFLAPKEREGWLVELIREYPNMQRHALRRALEALGVIGGSDSLPLLQAYFDEPIEPEVQIVCFWAIQSIHKRMGYLWYNGEEANLADLPPQRRRS